MKYFIAILTWPLVFVMFLMVCLIWLVNYSWAGEDDDLLSKGIKDMGYALMHLKCKP